MNTSHRNRIIIADDHPIFRKGLRDIIETDDRFRIVAEAGNGDEALILVRAHTPDILVLDIEMPQRDGLEVVRQLHDEEFPVAVLIITMHQTESIFNRAMDYGVTGYLLKDSAAGDIVNALLAVQNGRHYISPSLTDQALDRARGNHSALPELEALSSMEARILQRIASSKTSLQIAEELNISRRTVENHRMHISQKLSLRGNYSLLRYALENKDQILLRGFG